MTRATRLVTRRTWLLVGLLLVLVLIWATFHRQITQKLAVSLILQSKSPSEEFFEGLAKQSGNPAKFLERSWATGRVPHRQLVAAFLKDKAITKLSWFERVEPLVQAGTSDADMSVRELALAIMQSRKDPRLFECAQSQLSDIDPMVRLLGLDYLRKADAQNGVPILMKLLDDADLRVIAGAEVALTHWSGEDFGVRSRLATSSGEGSRRGVDPANAELIRRGIERREEWWQLHAQDYSQTRPVPSRSEFFETARPPVPDFALPDLNGRTIRLSDFRGKVVLLNFWATWCTACLAEIPDLIALKNKIGDQAAILGVALDGVPDEHGHEPGPEGDQPHSHASEAKAVRAKVARAAKAHGIIYPVLLDSKNSVGAQFNGGELPTTVIIDAKGVLRRRFIGERNLKVFEVMIAEAAKPRAP